MGNLFIAVGVIYAVALFVQVMFYAQSVKKAKADVAEETHAATMMTPQSV
jgi:hypothetical protein